MSVLLSVFATLLAVITIMACSNIYTVPDRAYYAARWAIVLWLGSVTAGLFALAIWLQ